MRRSASLQHATLLPSFQAIIEQQLSSSRLQLQRRILLHEQVSQRPIILQPLREHERLLCPLPAQRIVLLQVVVDGVIEGRGRQPLELGGGVAIYFLTHNQLSIYCRLPIKVTYTTILRREIDGLLRALVAYILVIR